MRGPNQVIGFKTSVTTTTPLRAHNDVMKVKISSRTVVNHHEKDYGSLSSVVVSAALVERACEAGI